MMQTALLKMKLGFVVLASLIVLQGLCISTAKTFTKREPFQSWKAPAGQTQYQIQNVHERPWQLDVLLIRFSLAFTETVNNYEIVSPVIRSRSSDFSGEVSHRLMMTGFCVFWYEIIYLNILTLCRHIPKSLKSLLMAMFCT